jgi:DNA (cytosine-5)-methyltransferase 1
MRILNLYACLGGNRYKWGDEHEVTAIELDEDLAAMYKKRFPKDIVIIADAHKYLLENFQNFDFIWSSPPCPSHCRVRFMNSYHNKIIPQYPDMKLYEEIIFLNKYFKGKYCVENVIPFYTPLIAGKQRGRHIYWTNFALPNELGERTCLIGSGTNEVNRLCEFHEIDLSNYKGKQRKDKIARNLVDFAAGATILNAAMNVYNNTSTQICLF